DSELARIPCGAPSIANCRVIASTPPLPAQCANAGDPLSAIQELADAKLMMEALPLAFSSGQPWCVIKNTESSSAASVTRHSSSDIPSIHLKTAVAAALSRISTRPASLSTVAMTACTAASSVRSACSAVTSPPASRAFAAVAGADAADDSNLAGQPAALFDRFVHDAFLFSRAATAAPLRLRCL